MSAETLLNRYELHVKAQGGSQKTVEHARNAVKLLSEFLGGITDVRDVSADDFRRFLVALRNRPGPSGRILSPTSINTYARGCRAFWAWLLASKHIEANPLAEVRAPKLPPRQPKHYTEDEIRAVLKAATNPRDNIMILVVLDCGITVSELSNLKIGDIGFDSGMVNLYRPKTNKRRTVFIETGALARLEDYIRHVRPKVPDDHVFLTEDGRPMSGHRIQQNLYRIGIKAGLSKKLSPHHLRHTFAYLWLRYGKNLDQLRQLLGHSDVKTSEIYLHTAEPDELGQVHKTASPVANLGLSTGKVRRQGIQPPAKFPKLVQAAPRDRMEIHISEPGERVYIDEEGNIFEV